MLIGIVGCGPWGDQYRKVLEELAPTGVRHWQTGREWYKQLRPQGLIVASATSSHYAVASMALWYGIPVLIEKPVACTVAEAKALREMAIRRGAGIAYAGHTRLYAPHWQAFKARCGIVHSVEAWAGGVNEGNPNAQLNWLAHLIPMCIDLDPGFDVLRGAKFHITQERRPLEFVVNGRHTFRDGPPGALANLVRAFITAVEKYGQDNDDADVYGLDLGIKALEYIDQLKGAKT